MRWHAHYHSSGTGHLYQGRFKSFPIEADEHLYRVLRYVEGNPLRANLVVQAAAWRWSSLHLRQTRDPRAVKLLHPWPIPKPADWLQLVDEADKCRVGGATPLDGARQSLWLTWMATAYRAAIGTGSDLRPPGRPKKKETTSKPIGD
jgi:putative transposase